MTGEKAKTAIRKIARWRFSVQLLSLAIWLDPLLVRCHTVCSPVFHCYSCPLATFACPIGVIANFSAIHMIPFLALGTLIVAGALAGSFICGWTCPFGLLQDLLDRVPTPKFVLPNWTGYFRFLVLLGLVIIVPYWWGDGHALFFCRVCPAGALEAAVPNTIHSAMSGSGVVWPTATKTVILLVFVVLALFTWRPWCSALCPLGVVFFLVQRRFAVGHAISPQPMRGMRRLPQPLPYGRRSPRPDQSNSLHSLPGMHPLSRGDGGDGVWKNEGRRMKGPVVGARRTSYISPNWNNNSAAGGIDKHSLGV
jgi:hypothetical protein